MASNLRFSLRCARVFHFSGTRRCVIMVTGSWIAGKMSCNFQGIWLPNDAASYPRTKSTSFGPFRCVAVREVEASSNVMVHAKKPDFVLRRNGRVHLNRRGRQFSRLLAAEVWASAVVMLDTPCSEVLWRVLATHSIRQFPLHFSSRASPCAITFQLESTTVQGKRCFLFWQR
jgi:hypothetical protein